MDERLALEYLEEVKEVFDNNKIPFWLEFGTLLGAIRDKKIIPWDDDIDLGILAEYVDSKFIKKKLTNELEKKGFSVYFLWDVMNIDKNLIKINVQLMRYNPKDHKKILLEKPVGGNFTGKIIIKIGRLLSVSYYGKIKFDKSNGLRYLIKINLFYLLKYLPKKFKPLIYKIVKIFVSPFYKMTIHYLDVPANYFLNLKTINFYGLKLKVPSSSKKYLEKKYGDWKKPTKHFEGFNWYELGDWVKKKHETFLIYSD